MKVTAYGKTHIGMKRKNNQDSILLDDELRLYVVADGMGGHKGGEVASSLAIEATQRFMTEAVKREGFSPEVDLVEAFLEANTQVYLKSREQEQNLTGMGDHFGSLFHLGK